MLPTADEKIITADSNRCCHPLTIPCHDKGSQSLAIKPIDFKVDESSSTTVEMTVELTQFSHREL